jgi:hypothetical protein
MDVTQMSAATPTVIPKKEIVVMSDIKFSVLREKIYRRAMKKGMDKL